MSSYRSSFLLVVPLLTHAQILRQWVGSTTCGNEVNEQQLSYTRGDDLTSCAAGVYGDGQYHHDFYTKIECVGGGARLRFFPDAACSKYTYSPQDIAANHLSAFRAGSCVPTKSGCCSYRISGMQSMVLPTCLKYSTTSTTKATSIATGSTTIVATTTSSTTTTTTSTATSTTAHDCSILPESMNGIAHPAGCSGAVWSNGSPSKSYCDGVNPDHSWWTACCKWDGDACTEKVGTATLVTTTILPQDCTTPEMSMNGDRFPAGCSGAVWSDGTASKKYCQGAEGEHPWWSFCCYWDGAACKEKEGTAVAATTTTKYYDCGELPMSMNGVAFAPGCAGAVYKDGTPSKSYCEGRDTKFGWWAACCQWNEISNDCVSRPVGGRRMGVMNMTEMIVV